MAHDLTYDEQRNEVIDYLHLNPHGKHVSILSSLKYEPTTKMLNTLNIFDIEVWVLILLSYLAVCSLNSFHINENINKIFTFIDYFVIMIGKSNSIIY